MIVFSYRTCFYKETNYKEKENSDEEKKIERNNDTEFNKFNESFFLLYAQTHAKHTKIQNFYTVLKHINISYNILYYNYKYIVAI